MHLTAATRNRWRRTWRSRAAVAGASVVALPPLPGIAPWHVLVVAVGEAVMMLRIGDAPA